MFKNWSFNKEYRSIRKKVLSNIDKVFKSDCLFFGNELKKFEKTFLNKNHSKFGIGVKSGTEALIIALKTLGIGPDDEVLTVSNTAIPTVSAIRIVGAKPVFVDINEEYLIDYNQIKNKITKKTKAIIAVHLYGQACHMDKIKLLAKKYNLKIIEDCAQAQGAKYKNKYVGNLGDIGCFSFYPTKILGAYGDGGFITTNNKNLFKKSRRIRHYGIEKLNKKNKYNNKYYAFEDGLNSRLDEVQASILNLKITKLNSYIRKRQKIAKIYNKELKNTSIILPKIYKYNEHVFHLYVVRHKKRDFILKNLKKKGINLNINYPYPIHEMKAYKNLVGDNCWCLNNTKKFSNEIFSLPVYPEIKDSDIKLLTVNLKKILTHID